MKAHQEADMNEKSVQELGLLGHFSTTKRRTLEGYARAFRQIVSDTLASQAAEQNMTTVLAAAPNGWPRWTVLRLQK
jgi:hypothetical protein